MTLVAKLKLATVAAVLAVLFAAGLWVSPANESAAAPVPKAKDEGLLWVCRRAYAL